MPAIVEEMLLSPERRDERGVDQVISGYFAFESSRFKFLLDCRDDASIEYPAVQWVCKKT